MKKILLSLMLCSLFYLGHAQKLTFDNISKVYIRSTGPIISGKEVSGYYFLYKVEKTDRQNSLFKLVFTDNNLNKVAEKEITMLSTNFVSDAGFDGKYISIKFLSLEAGGAFVSGPKKDGSETIKVFDTKGNEVKSIENTANGMAYYLHGLMSGGTEKDEIESNDLVALPNVGVIDIKPYLAGSGKMGMYGTKSDLSTEITMYPLTYPTKTWKYTSPSGSIELTNYLGSSDQISFFSIMQKTSFTSREVTFKSLCLDHTSGKTIVNKEFGDDKNVFDVNNFVYLPDTKQNIVSGTLIEKKKKTKRAATDGMFLAFMDNKGALSNMQTIAWDDFTEKFNLKEENGKPMEIDGIYVQKVVSTNDGKIFVIGEAYNGSSIKDFILIEVDKNLKPVKVTQMHKEAHAGGALGINQVGEAMKPIILKYWGDFDYAYTQERDDRSSFSICYTFKEKGVGYFGTITYSDGKFVKDKISLKTDASSIHVYAAKPGYVMIIEYFKKEKKMESRLEKFNF